MLMSFMTIMTLLHITYNLPRVMYMRLVIAIARAP